MLELQYQQRLDEQTKEHDARLALLKGEHERAMREGFSVRRSKLYQAFPRELDAWLTAAKAARQARTDLEEIRKEALEADYEGLAAILRACEQAQSRAGAALASLKRTLAQMEVHASSEVFERSRDMLKVAQDGSDEATRRRAKLNFTAAARRDLRVE